MFLKKRLSDVCANNSVSGRCRLEKLQSRVSSFENFCVLDPKNGEKGSSWKVQFGVVRKSIPIFQMAVNWRYRCLRPFSHKSTKHNGRNAIFVPKTSTDKIFNLKSVKLEQSRDGDTQQSNVVRAWNLVYRLSDLFAYGLRSVQTQRSSCLWTKECADSAISLPMD